jgi:RHS repeat-associated protein
VEAVKEFVYDGYKIVLEIENKTSECDVEKDIIWDPTLPDLSKPLCVKLCDMISLLFHDAKRNLSDIVSISNTETTICHVNYSATGEITSKTNIEQTSFLWASEYFDADLNLICYNYRFYNPQTGRWLTRDPIEDINDDVFSQTSINKTDYLMLSNDMVNNSDWLGLKEVRRLNCGSCVICIDNDTASGDGNHYKLHYTCNRNGSRPKGCRKGDGDEHGDAQYPLLTPSHGHSAVPKKIKKCLEKKLKWKKNPVTLPVADPITKCCKDEEFENWDISLSGIPALSATEYQIIVCDGIVLAAFVAFLIKVSPLLLLL